MTIMSNTWAGIIKKKWSRNHSQQKSPKRQYLYAISRTMISVHFQGKPFNTVIQVYALTSNTEEAEIERFYEDLQDLSELIPIKDVLFIIGDWNVKVGSQETPGSNRQICLGVQGIKQGMKQGKG